MSYDIPNLTTYMESDDNAIKQALANAGYTTYETTKEGEYPDGGFDIVKLPSDVSLAEAGVMYASISSLSATGCLAPPGKGRGRFQSTARARRT